MEHFPQTFVIPAQPLPLQLEYVMPHLVALILLVAGPTANRTTTAQPQQGMEVPLLTPPPPKAAPEPPPVIVEVPLSKGFYPSAYQGQIVSVTATSIAIKPCGDIRFIQVGKRPNGIVHKATYVQDNTREPIEFALSQELRKGIESSRASIDTAHKVADLRVGDIVYLYNDRATGVDTCTAIGIRRRPGGKVPPSQDDLNKTYHYPSRWDDKCNAEQFIEEVGMPAVNNLGLWFLR